MEITTTGMPLVALSSFSVRRTSHPSSSGSTMSRVMATGDSVLAISRAWRPSLATTDRKPPMESWCAIRLAAAGSSSMISTSGALLAAFGSCNTGSALDRSGSTARKVAPAPGLLSTQIRPPWRASIRRVRASPSPVPCRKRWLGPWTCSNSPKIRSCSSGEIPTPLSAT